MNRTTLVTEVIAHRGASSAEPEHTIAAYDRALDEGADTLELDVRAGADGELVIVHDPTLARTAGDPRAVADMTSAELAGLDGAARPLTLAEVLERYGRATRYLVELKDPAPAWERTVLDVLRDTGTDDLAVLQSFDPRALRRLVRAVPSLEVAPLLGHPFGLARRIEALAPWAGGVGVWHRRLDARLVRCAHDHGLVVRAWTVNDPGDVARVLRLGVDGVITDLPGVARTIADRTRVTDLLLDAA